MSNPKVSVVVLNWNGKHFLKDCLSSVLAQDYIDFEVLLVDNGSSDGSLNFVSDIFGNDERLRIVALPENYGFSKGNNLGIQAANGEYVIVLNNDTVVKTNFISALVAVAEKDDVIGSVGCNVLFLNGSLWFSQKFTNCGFISPFFLQTLVKRRITRISSGFRVNLANAACAVLYRKKALNIVGCFDEDFWSNWEDYDLGFRLNVAGYTSVSIPLSLVSHVGGGSEGFAYSRLVKVYRNILFTYVKNYELENLVCRFFPFMFIMLPLRHLFWVVDRLFHKRFDFESQNGYLYLFSLFFAYKQFLQQLPVFLKKRGLVNNLRKVSDKQIFQNTKMNIL